jgi:hypothetical protein
MESSEVDMALTAAAVRLFDWVNASDGLVKNIVDPGFKVDNGTAITAIPEAGEPSV